MSWCDIALLRPLLTSSSSLTLSPFSSIHATRSSTDDTPEPPHALMAALHWGSVKPIARRGGKRGSPLGLKALGGKGGFEDDWEEEEEDGTFGLG